MRGLEKRDPKTVLKKQVRLKKLLILKKSLMEDLTLVSTLNP